MERKDVNEETIFNQEELKNSQNKEYAWKQEKPLFNWFEVLLSNVKKWIDANTKTIFHVELVCLIVAIMLGSIKFELPLVVGISASVALMLLYILSPQSIVVFNYFFLIVVVAVLFVGIIVVIYVLLTIIIICGLTIALCIMVDDGIRKWKVFLAKRKRRLNSN